MPSSPHDDAWLAVQYVLGELSPTDRAGFEARLADDPGLCEHLAAAVVLTEALRLSARTTVVAPAPLPRRRLTAALAVAAAALCLVLAVLPRDERSPQRGEPGAAARLVSFWRGQAQPVASEDDFDSDDHAEWASDQVPSWMIAAVSLERRKSAPGEEPNEQWEEN